MASPAAHRFFVLGAALLFSTGGALVKATQLDIWQVACFRSSIAALTVALWMPRWRRLDRRTLLVGAAFAATMIGFVAGNKLTTAANTIFLQATAPVYLLVFGPLLLRERLKRIDLVLAVVLAFGMAMFFVGVEPPSQTAPNPRLGNLVAAGAGVSWALTILGLRWLARSAGPDEDPAGAAVLSGNVIAGLVTLPAALSATAPAPADWLIVAILGVFQIGFAYVLLTRGMRGVPAFEASLLLLLEPVAGTLWAALFHAERPGGWSLTGCAVIFVATALRALAARNAGSSG